MMEGEDRLTHNRNVTIEKFESQFEYDDTVSSFLCTESVQEKFVRRELVELALSMMTERQRTIVTLHYVEGLGIQEIAEIYGISHQAVSVTLAGVRKKFQKKSKFFE